MLRVANSFQLKIIYTSGFLCHCMHGNIIPSTFLVHCKWSGTFQFFLNSSPNESSPNSGRHHLTTYFLKTFVLFSSWIFAQITNTVPLHLCPSNTQQNYIQSIICSIVPFLVEYNLYYIFAVYGSTKCSFFQNIFSRLSFIDIEWQLKNLLCVSSHLSNVTYMCLRHLFHFRCNT